MGVEHYFVSYRILSSGLVFWFFLFSHLALANNEEAPHYLIELQQQAQQKKLAQARVWQRLLKYNPQLFRGVISEADGLDFFNAPQGKTDSDAELAATLASFFFTAF